jgi:hypothetical protein
MQIWTCAGCGQPLYFENYRCLRCGATVGFLPDVLQISSLQAMGDGRWQALGEAGRGAYRSCANQVQHGACNWMIADADPDPYCVSCRLNRRIPDLGNAEYRQRWLRLEGEKRRLVYGLLRLGLQVIPKSVEAMRGLAFDFLADGDNPGDPAAEEGTGVVTGHYLGLITLNIAEADDVVRERLRRDMQEPYRTLLGHFRHETGHYYWNRLVMEGGWTDAVRTRFGDDRADYAEALQRHYQQGPAADWQSHFVSAYASSHPWEDWAESWAHYLHMVDTLETASRFGLRLRIDGDALPDLKFRPGEDPYSDMTFDRLIQAWLPLTVALNNLNRSMGLADAYPFVLSGPALDKLRLVHAIVRRTAGRTEA